MTKGKQKEIKTALIPLIVLIFLLIMCVVFFFDNTMAGPNQTALVFSGLIAIWLAWRRGVGKKEIIERIKKRVNSSLYSVLILLVIGALAGTWLISGVVPAFIYYGLGFIEPKLFLFTTVIVCSMVSLATGSSWSTVATVGIALNGIGQVMGIHPGLIAGAIISGAYFGDKVSPLSDTTNLASALTNTDIFVHIRYMMYTTIPALVITLILFLFIGFSIDYVGVESNIEEIKENIIESFNITPWLMIVPALLIVLIVSKVKAVPALLIGCLSACLFALVFQRSIMEAISESYEILNFSEARILLRAVFFSISIPSDNEVIRELFQSGGMWGMKNTVLLIIAAMIFSGAMEAAGFLEIIARQIIKHVVSTGSLVLSTVVSSIFFNLTASDQYIAIVVPARMFSEIYKKKGIKSEVLSRAIEDGGTQTSVLVPWNTCGATQSRILGTSVFTYLPFCFFNILSPVFSVLWAYLDFKIRKTDKNKV